MSELLRRVSQTRKRKDRALEEYRDALVAARESGAHTYKEIGDAAGIYATVAFEIIKKRKGESER